MIEESRLRELNDRPVAKGEYVLYWMQASQRTRFNHALEYAIERANALTLQVVVCFGLMDDYPEANARHYAFMLEGLRDVAVGLKKRGIPFVVKHGPPGKVALDYAKDAAIVVCDRGYTRHQKRWRDEVADGARCAVLQVESDVVVPVDVASDKHEFAARTIRPKIHKHWNDYLKPLGVAKAKFAGHGLPLRGDMDVTDPALVLSKLKLDWSVRPVPQFEGGEVAAKRLLRRFVREKLRGYASERNEPSIQHTSMLSPYLHFGQISPIEVALAAKGADAPQADRESLLEELVVRRELAMNFVNFHPKYDNYECLPNWATGTMKEHANDKREYLYTLSELESARTHDRYWNAAQTEMVKTGYMHNYMRMYWGKKIIEWTKSPKVAFETALYLNNKWFLDGRDPNSYANVAWLFGLHDRPWGPARPVFGLVRYMNAAGLERKFDMEAYVNWVAAIKSV